jgi:hypothetical protein
MLRKFVFAFVLVIFSLGVLSAAELTGRITKVDGGKIYFQEGKKGEDKKFEFTGEPKAYTVAKDAKFLKGGGGKKKAEPMPLEGGLNAELFKNISEKGIIARITTNDDNVVTQVQILGGGKGKKKDADK